MAIVENLLMVEEIMTIKTKMTILRKKREKSEDQPNPKILRKVDEDT